MMLDTLTKTPLSHDILSQEQQQSLGKAFESIEQGEEYGGIKIIRQNSWPLITENKSQIESQIILDIEDKYGIPRVIITELLGNLQAIGFLPGRKIELDQEAKNNYTQESAQELISGISATSTTNKEEFIEQIDIFFKKLSTLKIIKLWKENLGEKEEISYGLFRLLSLFDTKFSRFENLEEFLDFLFINIAVQDKFFDEQYLDILKETSGLPIDDIEGKETARFSESKYVSEIGKMKINNQNIPVNLRIIPGFSPAGLGYTISLDLPTIDGKNSKSNYCFISALYFERKGKSIIPIIHTLQNSFHNIGINNNGNIFHVNEPLTKEAQEMGISLLEGGGDEQVSQKQKMKIKQEILRALKDDVFSGLDPSNEALALILDKIFCYGFSEVGCLNGKDNLWLTGHSGRDESSVNETIEKMYSQRIKTLGGKFDTDSSMYTINFRGLTRYLSRYPEVHKKYSELSTRIDGIVSNLKGIKKYIEDGLEKDKKYNRMVSTVESECLSVLEDIERVLGRVNMAEDFVEIYNNMVSSSPEAQVSLLETDNYIGRNHLREGITALTNKTSKAVREIAEEKFLISQNILYTESIGLGNSTDIDRIKSLINSILEIRI